MAARMAIQLDPEAAVVGREFASALASASVFGWRNGVGENDSDTGKGAPSSEGGSA
jgi:hypothetical protein